MRDATVKKTIKGELKYSWSEFRMLLAEKMIGWAALRIAPKDHEDYNSLIVHITAYLRSTGTHKQHSKAGE